MRSSRSEFECWRTVQRPYEPKGWEILPTVVSQISPNYGTNPSFFPPPLIPAFSHPPRVTELVEIDDIEPDFNHFQCWFTTISITGISDFLGVNFAKKSQSVFSISNNRIKNPLFVFVSVHPRLIRIRLFDYLGVKGALYDIEQVVFTKVGNEPSKAHEHHERAERAEHMSEQTLLSVGERAW